MHISFCRYKEPAKILESPNHILDLCLISSDNNSGNMLLSVCNKSRSRWLLWLNKPLLEKHTFHVWLRESLKTFMEALVASCGTFLTVSDNAKSNSHEISLRWKETLYIKRANRPWDFQKKSSWAQDFIRVVWNCRERESRHWTNICHIDVNHQLKDIECV